MTISTTSSPSSMAPPSVSPAATPVNPRNPTPGSRLLASGVSQVAALAWEYWRLVRVRVLAALIGIGCLDALYYQMATLISDDLPPEVQTNLFLAIFFTNLTLIVLVLVRTREVDERHGGEIGPRVFLLPLPTWQLVLWRLALPAATAAGLWLAISSLTLAVSPQGATGDDWPLLGPALVAATFTALGLAITWLPLHPKALKTLLTWILLAVPARWTALRFDSSGEGPPQIWHSVTGSELLTLVGFLLAAYALALFGTRHARRSSTLGWPDLRAVVDGFGQRHRKPVRGRFRSPTTAQLWFEWRHKGWIVPFYLACGMALAAILYGLRHDPLHNPILLLGVLIKVAMFFLVAAPAMVGCLMGRFSQSRREAAIDLFRASRPLGDTTLAYTILATGALSLLASWGSMVGTILAVMGVADLASPMPHLETVLWVVEANVEALGWREGPLAIAVLLVFSWTNMALVTTVFLTGRNRVVAALVFVPYGLAIGAYLVFGTMGSEAISDLVVVGSWAVSGVAVLGTTAAFVVAFRRRLIGPRLLLASLAGLAALILAFVLPRLEQIQGFYETGVALERATMVLIPGVLALAVAPLSLAPLALFWNRHR